MSDQSPRLRWGVEQRLEFIEFRLFWEGGINRSDITTYFGVSVPQASNDLSQYQQLEPNNIFYDRSEKRYLATHAFAPRFLKPDADYYLSQLKAAANSSLHNNHNLLCGIPKVDAMPIPHRRVIPAVLRSIVSAIRERASIEVLYQSMNIQRTEPIWRRITPHAFGTDGLRWHTRAFCHIRKEFRDFLLSRCLDTKEPGEAGADPEDDGEWNEYFSVVLMPNPRLGEHQQKIIALDYDMIDNCIAIPVRRALLYYFNKRLRLDVVAFLDNPNEVPVIVANFHAFKSALSGK